MAAAATAESTAAIDPDSPAAAEAEAAAAAGTGAGAGGPLLAASVGVHWMLWDRAGAPAALAWDAICIADVLRRSTERAQRGGSGPVRSRPMA